MDELESLNATKNVAMLSRSFYEALLEQKFDQGQAMKLTVAYVHGVMGGRLEQ